MIDVLELSGVRQLSPITRMIEFKTAGPYVWVRHPIYSAWVLVVFCVPTMTMTRLVFAATSSAYLLLAIPFEERSLHAAAAAYGEYVRRVRWKLVPGIYGIAMLAAGCVDPASMTPKPSMMQRFPIWSASAGRVWKLDC